MKPSAYLLAIALAIPVLAQAELRAGTARVEVTPPVGGLMYGYGARGTNVSTGVHDPLLAKALVLRNSGEHVAIVTLDLGSMPAEYTRNIKRQVAASSEIENILLVASHTHSAPRFQEDFPTADDPWVREMERKIANAIVEATENLAPATIHIGYEEAETGHNRRLITVDGEVIMLWANRDRHPTAPVDPTVGVIRVDGADGNPIAVLVNYAVHPVVLGPENLEISADYVGYMCNAVESALGGQAMFLQGAAGDINPFWDKTPPAEGAFEKAKETGETVAAAAVDAARFARPIDTDPAMSFRTERIALAARSDVPRETRDIPAEINTVLIGDELAIATFPGEFFVEHGLALRNRSRIPHTFFVGYTNDALGYFPTIQATTEGGYGAASATRVEVGAGERLVNRALVNLYYQADLIHP